MCVCVRVNVNDSCISRPWVGFVTNPLRRLVKKTRFVHFPTLGWLWDTGWHSWCQSWWQSCSKVMIIGWRYARHSWPFGRIGQEIWQRPCRSHRQAVLILHIRRTNRHTGPLWVCCVPPGTMTCLVLSLYVWTRQSQGVLLIHKHIFFSITMYILVRLYTYEKKIFK